ncbi:MAG: CDP-alcohol phosphatidyltransferase family protein [Chitinivibrionales bacterium]|nr:CDP-alcohol phosphatidyltransferase family protein [Chitinivibrionales bacterium]
MIEGLKPFYERILRPALRLFVRLGVKPNDITVFGVFLFGLSAWYCAEGRWGVATAFLVVAAFMDGWDGLLARETGQKTDFGAILDSTCDRITEILLFGGLFVYYANRPAPMHAGMYVSFIAVTGSLMVSYVKARSEGQGVACRGGILQRPERIILLAVFLVSGPTVMLWGVGALGALAYATMLQRIWIVRRGCRRAPGAIDQATPGVTGEE